MKSISYFILPASDFKLLRLDRHINTDRRPASRVNGVIKIRVVRRLGAVHGHTGSEQNVLLDGRGAERGIFTLGDPVGNRIRAAREPRDVHSNVPVEPPAIFTKTIKR